MNAYKAAFVRYVQEHPLKYMDVDMEQLMEVFYHCYGEKPETGPVRELFARLHVLRQPLPPEVGEALFDTVCDLCLEKERLAFLEGVRVGGQLILEIGR